MIENTFHIFTWLGDFERVLIIGFFIIAILLYKGLTKEAIILFCMVAIAKVMSILLKYFFAISRPETELWLTDASGYSFPSGHATVAMALYGILGYILWKNVNNKNAKYFWVVICLLLISGISFSRVILGVHWLTDILGGWLLGGITLLFVIFVFKKINFKI